MKYLHNKSDLSESGKYIPGCSRSTGQPRAATMFSPLKQKPKRTLTRTYLSLPNIFGNAETTRPARYCQPCLPGNIGQWQPEVNNRATHQGCPLEILEPCDKKLSGILKGEGSCTAPDLLGVPKKYQ